MRYPSTAFGIFTHRPLKFSMSRAFFIRMQNRFRLAFTGNFIRRQIVVSNRFH